MEKQLHHGKILPDHAPLPFPVSVCRRRKNVKGANKFSVSFISEIKLIENQTVF